MYCCFFIYLMQILHVNNDIGRRKGMCVYIVFFQHKFLSNFRNLLIWNLFTFHLWPQVYLLEFVIDGDKTYVSVTV
jgi:hypothetical protein